MKKLIAVGLLPLVGCAPIQSTTSSMETVLSTDTVVTEPQSSFMTAKVEATPTAGSLHVTQSGSCEEKRVETVRVRKTIKRSAKRSALIFEIAAAGVGIGLGAGIAVDSSNVADDNDPLQTNPVSQDQALQIGLAVLGLGVVAGAVAGIDLMRAKDKLGEEKTIKRDVEGQSKIITCNESVVADQDVGLVIHGRYVHVGKLDGKGNLSFGWDVVPAELIDQADWPGQATVAVGPSGEIQSLVEGGGKLTGEAVGQITLEHARAAVAQQAWQAAIQADTLDAFKQFADQFPESHTEDIGAEIDKRDVEGRARRKAEQVAGLWDLYDNHFGADELVPAGETLAEIAQVAPDDARLAEARTQLTERKQARADELVAEGRKALRAKDFARAMEVLGEAQEIVPDHAGAQKYLARAKSKEVKRLLKEAKALTRQGDYAGASDLIERAAVIDPNERGVEKARADVEKRAGAAAAKTARDEARRKAKEEEAAAKDAARAKREAEREAAKAERERLREAKQAERAEKALERKRGNFSLEYRVDDAYADDNLLVKMRYPQDCTAKPRTKRISKDKVGAELHLVRTVEVKCEGYSFELVKDKTEISAECVERTCGECTDTVEWMLEPAAADMRRDSKKLKKVKSCR